MEELAQSGRARAVVITGAGEEAFCSGYDISAIPTGADGEAESASRAPNPLDSALRSVVQYPYFTIAMVGGHAFGAGCELAASCDLRVGREGIRMGMPPARLGLVYPVANLMRFVELLGVARCREVFLTARSFAAGRAKEIGLLDYVVPKEELFSFTRRIAEEAASNAPLAVRGMKRILGMLSGASLLNEADQREADRIVAEAFASRDLKEGQAAFLEKRKPVFRGE
jgi:enoyl-CoA hydratase/carnithine racemase